MHKRRSRFPRWFLPAALLVGLLLAMTSACLTTPAALAETPPSIQWSQTFGGSSWDGGLSVQQTAEGGYVIAGTTYS
jgi:starvation-inducible outer membrane lipoprotein